MLNIHVKYTFKTHKLQCSIVLKSHFKVMGFTIEFRVCSISPDPFERFSLNLAQMFLSVRRCAEPKTRTPRLLFKVTVQGHP